MANAPTPEQLAEFVSLPPPRDIPRAFAARTKRRGMRLLTIFGAIFFTMGMFFTWMFFPPRLVDEFRMRSGDLTRAKGIVVASEETMYSEGGGENSPGTPVHRHVFRFTTPDGAEHTGTCYETGRARAEGKKVRIEFMAGAPSVARIRGSRLNPFGLLAGIVVIFPAVGLLMMFFPWWARRKRLRLLRDGTFTFGEIIDVKRTNMQVNGEHRHNVTIRFEVEGAPTEVTSPAYGRDAEIALRRLQQSEKIGVLYDSRRPDRCLFTARLLDQSPL